MPLSQNISSTLDAKDITLSETSKFFFEWKLCVIEIKNYLNPYMVILFTNGQITQCQEGVHF